MADLINLRAARKAAARAKARAKGDENAAQFGRSPAEKAAQQQRAEKAARQLEAHRRIAKPD
jgi:hypothetical protein